MDHFTTRLAPGGVQRLSSRFWQADAQPLPRVELICPQPRRFQLPLNTATNPKPNGASPVYRADTASDVLDLILSKGDRDADTDSSSKATFFCGSPPVRTNNPVVHDPMFGEKTPSLSPLGSSFAKKLAARVEVGSPSCGASSPKVRIEGFACGNKESHCAIA